MQLTRRTLIAAMLAAVGLAIWAPSAFGSGAIRVQDTDNSASDCPSVTSPTSGGCLIHFVGPGTYFIDFLGLEIEEAGCTMELEGRIGPNGSGYWNKFESSPGEPDCPVTMVACELPWAFSSEETGASQVEMTSEMCLDPAEMAGVCEGEVMIFLHTNTMPIAAGLHDDLGMCELEFDLVNVHDEPHEEIRIAHL
jgi:hypothetical protein